MRSQEFRRNSGNVKLAGGCLRLLCGLAVLCNATAAECPVDIQQSLVNFEFTTFITGPCAGPPTRSPGELRENKTWRDVAAAAADCHGCCNVTFDGAGGALRASRATLDALKQFWSEQWNENPFTRCLWLFGILGGFLGLAFSPQKFHPPWENV